MDKIAVKLGCWSALTIAVLVVLIDIGMISSALLLPQTISNIETYAASFTSWQMLPFIPSLILAPMFVIFMLSIYHYAGEEKRIYGQLGLYFSLVCAAILSVHYYVQLTVVQQGLLSGETDGLWILVTPNPHSLFWTLAALGYGFMGFAMLAVTPIFPMSQRALKWLFTVNGALGVAFIVSNGLGFFFGNILISIAWGILFPVASVLVCKNFKQAPTQVKG